jgi:predicted amidophosphoribosyltransferase
MFVAYNYCMSEQLPADMKVCPYCGQLTSTKANFCYYCARELVARPEHPAEAAKPFHVNWRVVGVILAIVLVVVITLFLLR